MQKHEIEEAKSYQTYAGSQYYVHEITGERISYCRIGELKRLEASLGRFAAVMQRQIPNQ